MEGRIVVTALVLTILAACSKQDIVQSYQSPSINKQEISPAMIISDWESVPLWNTLKNSEATVFTYQRKFPGIKKSVLDNGIVLVFARNLWTGEPALKDLDDVPGKPLMMPFYFLPYFEKPDYTEQWNYSAEDEGIQVSLEVKGTTEANMPRKKIQLRYVVLPEKILKEKNQTREAVRKLSYEELLRTFASSPS